MARRQVNDHSSKLMAHRERDKVRYNPYHPRRFHCE
jgi:hypothetical protein